jgi:hypothetical protein
LRLQKERQTDKKSKIVAHSMRDAQIHADQHAASGTGSPAAKVVERDMRKALARGDKRCVKAVRPIVSGTPAGPLLCASSY